MGKQVGRHTQYTISSSVIVAMPQRVFKANPHWIALDRGCLSAVNVEAIVLLALGMAQDFRLYR